MNIKERRELEAKNARNMNQVERIVNSAFYYYFTYFCRDKQLRSQMKEHLDLYKRDLDEEEILERYGYVDDFYPLKKEQIEDDLYNYLNSWRKDYERANEKKKRK